MTICYAPVGTNIPIIIKCYDWNRIPLDAGIYNPNSLSAKHYTLRLDFNFGKIMALVHIQVGLWRGLRWGEMGLAGKTGPVRRCPGAALQGQGEERRGPWLYKQCFVVWGHTWSHQPSWGGPSDDSAATGTLLQHLQTPLQNVPGADPWMRSRSSRFVIKGHWRCAQPGSSTPHP